jgi:hypothetical protein
VVDLASISKFSDSPEMRIYSVSDETLPENTFIICSQASRDVLYKPHLAGIELQNAMEKVGETLVKGISKIALKGSTRDKTVELIYMSGGLFYGINHGFKKVHKFAIPQCFIGIQRVRIEGTEGQFSARVGYGNFESLPNNATVIIGDTIATAATMVKGLQYLEDELFEKGYKLDKLVIATLAGSTEGARKIKKTFDKLKGDNPGLKTYLIAAEQLFTLMPDGTDLRFLEHDSIMPEETKQYTLSTYGEWLGKNMKCAVFDWGTRCKNPKKHYHEFLEFVEEELANRSMPQDAKLKLEEMKKEAQKGLEGLKKAL